MTSWIKLQPLVQITDPDFQVGFEEAQEPIMLTVACVRIWALSR
jgi:hypothetical protein